MCLIVAVVSLITPSLYVLAYMWNNGWVKEKTHDV